MEYYTTPKKNSMGLYILYYGKKAKPREMKKGSCITIAMV